MVNKGLLTASSSLVGTIIGAGIFGIPYTFAKAGFLAGTLFFVVLAALILLLHLMYAEVVERTSEKHRLIGYSKKYFGDGVRDLVSLSVVVSVFGSLVVYIILANNFVADLFGSPDTALPFLWGGLFWLLLSIAIIKGIKTIARVEMYILGILVITLVMLIFKGAPLVQVSNFSGVNWSNVFLPYGVILFSLGGFAAVPEIRSLLPSGGKTFLRSVIIGFMVAAIITYLFAFVVVGVSGASTSEDAIGGLLPFIGPVVGYLGAIFGVMTLMTSYLVIGINLKESFMYDWGMSKAKSELLVVVVPMALVLMGIRNFISVIAITGSIMGAVNGSMIALLFAKAKKHGDREPEFSISIPKFIIGLLILILVIGGIYETINVIK
ncbi:MAG: aromatic amino acid transport family protein [Candidatus Spechtbacterales bacterium]|nr:aromatic amino acid transport family protein [Candidatus Spechtbacterales bacterium]